MHVDELISSLPQSGHVYLHGSWWPSLSPQTSPTDDDRAAPPPPTGGPGNPDSQSPRILTRRRPSSPSVLAMTADAGGTKVHFPVRHPGQRSCSSTSRRALSTCRPHPAHVALPQVVQVSFQHMVDGRFYYYNNSNIIQSVDSLVIKYLSK